MGSFSIWHWIIVLFVLAIPIWLCSRTVARAGFSAWWGVLCIVPVINVIMLWVFAYAKWPALPER